MKKLLLVVSILTATLAVSAQKRVAPVKTAEQKLNEQYCSGLFKTTEGTYFDMLDSRNSNTVGGYLNILDWLQGRVAGLQVYRTRYNDRVPLLRNSRAGIYVDELYRDADYLNSLPVTDIAMIKIIKGPFAGGFNSPGGVIAIYTIGTEEEEEE